MLQVISLRRDAPFIRLTRACADTSRKIVWKATTLIGCGISNCEDGTIFTGYNQPSTYLVCEY
jgi:hypothetical protein